MQDRKRFAKLRLVGKNSPEQDRPVDLVAIEGPVARLMDEMCELVSHVAGASMVLIAREQQGSDSMMRVVGRTGTLVSEVDLRRVVSLLNPRLSPMLVSLDVRADPRLSGDPQLKLMPHIKSMISMLVPSREGTPTTVLYIVNPRRAALQDGGIVQILSDACSIISDVLELRAGHAREIAGLREAGLPGGVPRPETRSFREHPGASAAEGDARAAATFLFETLVRRRGLHSRKGSDYISLRTWRLPIKKYQISALVAIKEEPAHGFVLRVADELAAHVRQAHGEQVIRSVVPVPPGSSGKAASLSTMLAEEVARMLGAQYANALELIEPVPLGKSTPHKSAHLVGYRLNRPVEGPVLIVDDVASSGRHIELAITACKSPTTAVYALAWIGK